MKIIGFTGTSHGMTMAQIRKLRDILRQEYEESAEFHHGDCVGADATAHLLAVDIGYVIHIHPPVKDKARAFCDVDKRGKIHPVLPYLVRNREIVAASQMLIAAPEGFAEMYKYSGTWATVRYGHTAKLPITIIWPDSRTSSYEPGINMRTEKY